MKKSFIFVLGFPLFAAAAHAATVTVENDKVTVDQTGQATTVVQTGVVPVVAPVAPVAAYAAVQDPRHLEGEIVNVDYPSSEILVRDIDNRERRVTLKQGMINTYRTGDYVEIYLMADMKEAKTIHTRRTADVEGEITSVDYANNLIVVRDANGANRNVLVRPGIIGEHKVGDRLKLYVAVDNADPAAVRLIRIR